ncbi:tetratricopeptide repeat protein [Camelliibacillus cellulosilyticus]|uniref:Tetratricopeptide repeat protein n=1 Tax=Camelliibacillus cellulosilyticus TaxID=2174486 RepID=A0ABV9GK22_9BACL
MEAVVLPSIEVTSLLNDWYLYIKFQSLDEANRIKKALDDKKQVLERDQAHMIYYMLLDFRYKLMLRQFDQAATDLTKIEAKKDQMDGLLAYYYLFFKGNYEYDLEHYDKAIECYQLAEDALKNVPDEIEKAEFHFRVGAAYYQIDYLTLALPHAEKALNIYKLQKNYIKKTADGHILLGAIYTDIGNYTEALTHYKESKKYYNLLNDPKNESITLQNLGWLYSKMGNSHKAIQYFESSLDKTDHLDYQLKTLYLLTKECFKNGFMDKGVKWLNKGVLLASENMEKVFEYRFKVLKALYFNQSDTESVLLQAINYFKRLNLWEYVEAYSLDLAEYYQKKQRYKEASEWLLNFARSQKKFSNKI